MSSRLSRGVAKMNSGTIGGQSRIASPVRHRLGPSSMTVPQPSGAPPVSTPSDYAIGFVYQSVSFAPTDLTITAGGTSAIDVSPFATFSDVGSSAYSGIRGFVYADSGPLDFDADWVIVEETTGVTEVTLPGIPSGNPGDRLFAWVLVENFPVFGGPDWGGYTQGFANAFDTSAHSYGVQKIRDVGETAPTWTGFETDNHIMIAMTSIPSTALYDSIVLNEDISYSYPTATEIDVPPWRGSLSVGGPIIVSADPEGGLQHIELIEETLA